MISGGRATGRHVLRSGRATRAASVPPGRAVPALLGASAGVATGLLAARGMGAAATVTTVVVTTTAGVASAVATAGPVPAGSLGRWERVLRAAFGAVATAGAAALSSRLAGDGWRAHEAGAGLLGPAVALGALAAAAPTGVEARRPGDLPPACAAWKRLLDLCIGGVTLLMASPVIAIAAVCITIESRGGWLYAQTRVGKGGRPIRVYKLRTMIADNDDRAHRAYVEAMIRGDAEPVGGVYKLTDDPRRTRVGRFLRQYSIDELPQLWNVVRGDMSLVGPRAPLAAEVALYDDATLERIATKPGLTGLWQVSGRSRLSFQEMVELDVRYGREWTPWLDVRILVRTPAAVLSGDGTA